MSYLRKVDFAVTSVKTENIPPYCLLCCSLCFLPFSSHSLVYISFHLLQLCLFVAESLSYEFVKFS